MNKVTFEVNTPVVVRLASEPVTVQGRFGDQAKLVLPDGQVAFVPLFVRDKLKELGVQTGDEVVITKNETRNGNRRSVQWEVRRTASNGTGQAGVNGSASAATNGTNGKKYGFYMERALEKAIDVVVAVEKYASERGLCDGAGDPFKFSSEDIRAIALSMYIDSSRNGHAAA